MTLLNRQYKQKDCCAVFLWMFYWKLSTIFVALVLAGLFLHIISIWFTWYAAGELKKTQLSLKKTRKKKCNGYYNLKIACKLHHCLWNLQDLRERTPVRRKKDSCCWLGTPISATLKGGWKNWQSTESHGDRDKSEV